jgi:hypothetical protein
MGRSSSVRLAAAVAVAVLATLAAVQTASAQNQRIRDRNDKIVLVIDNDGRRLRVDDKVVAEIEWHSKEQGHCSFLGADGKRKASLQNGLVYDEADKRLRIATLDGDDLRHGDRGKVMMHYDAGRKEFSPTASDNRVYTVEGDALDKAQFVAVMWVLNPEIFKLTQEEADAQIKAYKEAEEAEAKRAAQDIYAGKFSTLNFYIGDPKLEKADPFPADAHKKGTYTLTPKGKEFVLIEGKYPDGTAWQGLGKRFTKENSGGDVYLGVASGPAGTTHLGVYTIKGGTLTGGWHPIYAPGDASKASTEVLSGPAELKGEFNITEAKGLDGKPYTGTATFHPQEGGDYKFYMINWKIGEANWWGVGVVVDDKLFVATGAAKQFHVGVMKTNTGASGVRNLDFLTIWGAPGYYVIDKEN